MKIILFGSNGQVGTHLQNSLFGLGEIKSCSRENANLEDLAQLQKISRYLLIEFPAAQKFIRPGFDETKYDHIR